MKYIVCTALLIQALVCSYSQALVSVIQDSASTIAFQIQSYAQIVNTALSAAKTVENQIKTLEKFGEAIGQGKVDSLIKAFRYQGLAFQGISSTLDGMGKIKFNKEIFDRRYTSKGAGDDLKFFDKNGKLLTAEEIRDGNYVNIASVKNWKSAQSEFARDNLSKSFISLSKSQRNIANILRGTKYYTESMHARNEEMDLLMQELGHSESLNGSMGIMNKMLSIHAQQNEDLLNLTLAGYNAAGTEKQLQEERKALEEIEKHVEAKDTLRLLNGAPDYPEPVENNFFKLHEQNKNKR